MGATVAQVWVSVVANIVSHGHTLTGASFASTSEV
jgi:hypothetical protein